MASCIVMHFLLVVFDSFIFDKSLISAIAKAFADLIIENKEVLSEKKLALGICSCSRSYSHRYR